ncbi:hypothetical protein AMTR_s00010p00255240 [Amborella trichopoda]|uniref:Uncharacterized protein n=1 Tax=Amborella trichopoda TaxID=13333 RepID=W1NGR8_AMBTC|nr:hypothetical protein AMTR_s00010p00255240 [Amborella trichopoda]
MRKPKVKKAWQMARGTRNSRVAIYHGSYGQKSEVFYANSQSLRCLARTKMRNFRAWSGFLNLQGLIVRKEFQLVTLILWMKLVQMRWFSRIANRKRLIIRRGKRIQIKVELFAQEKEKDDDGAPRISKSLDSQLVRMP